MKINFQKKIFFQRKFNFNMTNNQMTFPLKRTHSKMYDRLMTKLKKCWNSYQFSITATKKIFFCSILYFSFKMLFQTNFHEWLNEQQLLRWSIYIQDECILEIQFKKLIYDQIPVSFMSFFFFRNYTQEDFFTVLHVYT